jgi:hypothetical protein
MCTANRARILGVSRRTIYRYLDRHPELQERRTEVVAMLCDKARANVDRDVADLGNVRTSIRVLENNDPAWRNKQTVEHTGTLNLTAGLLSKEDILKLSDAELDKLERVRTLKLAALQDTGETGADDVREQSPTGDRTDRAPETTD